MRVKMLDVVDFRGIRGRVEFGDGLNVIVGPNCSGKTGVLEALAYLSTLSYSNLREVHALLTLLHAARGSVHHSIAALIAGEKGGVSGTFVSRSSSLEEKTTLYVKKRITYEAIHTEINPVVVVDLEAKPRGCKLEYRLGPHSMALSFTDECVKGELSVGVVTPGVYPYNMFDELVGRAKREESPVWRVLKKGIRIGETTYTVDVAADEWGRLAAYVIEHAGDNTEIVPFYTVGRGLQRALLILSMLEYADLVLIDEVESAMHPELLTLVAQSIARAVKGGRQVIVTTQSLEAARFLAAAMLEAPPSEWRRPEALLTRLGKERGEDLAARFSLIVLSKHGRNLRAVRFEGVEAIEEVVRGEDIRMLYTLLGGGE